MEEINPFMVLLLDIDDLEFLDSVGHIEAANQKVAAHAAGMLARCQFIDDEEQQNYEAGIIFDASVLIDTYERRQTYFTPGNQIYIEYKQDKITNIGEEKYLKARKLLIDLGIFISKDMGGRMNPKKCLDNFYQKFPEHRGSLGDWKRYAWNFGVVGFEMETNILILNKQINNDDSKLFEQTVIGLRQFVANHNGYIFTSLPDEGLLLFQKEFPFARHVITSYGGIPAFCKVCNLIYVQGTEHNDMIHLPEVLTLPDTIPPRPARKPAATRKATNTTDDATATATTGEDHEEEDIVDLSRRNSSSNYKKKNPFFLPQCRRPATSPTATTVTGTTPQVANYYPAEIITVSG
jgi:hypothetical protein